MDYKSLAFAFIVTYFNVASWLCFSALVMLFFIWALVAEAKRYNPQHIRSSQEWSAKSSVTFLILFLAASLVPPPQPPYAALDYTLFLNTALLLIFLYDY